MKTLHARRALLPDGWAADIEIGIDAAGLITRVRPGASRGEASEPAGLLLPGIANVHSHAFQRALAGRTEYAGSGPDTFWGWRERMYELAESMTPESLNADRYLALR